MRITLNTIINNPDLPLVDPLMGLVNDSTVAVYGMMDKLDSSGRSSPLETSVKFDAQGAILTPDAASVITTPVAQTDEFTVIYAWNLTRPSGVTAVMLNTMTPASAPYSGVRMATSAVGQEFIQSGTGKTSPTINSLDTYHSTGNWIVQAISMNATRLDKYRLNNSSVEGMDLVNTPVNIGTKWRINGVGPDLPAPITGGYNGKLGLVAFYNKKLDQETIAALLVKAGKVLQNRGITV